MSKETKILVVEDEERIAKLLRNRLEAEDYKVLVAYTGDEGLKLARTEDPNLILLDIMLPKMNGYVVARLLKFDRRFQHIPIIMLTARQSPEDIQRGYGVHADVYVTKPFNAATLLRVIEEVLRKAPAKGKLVVDVASGPLWVDGMEVAKPDRG